MKTQKRIILLSTTILILLISMSIFFSCDQNSSKNTIFTKDPIVGKWGSIDQNGNEKVVLQVREENGKLVLEKYYTYHVEDHWSLVYNKEEKIYKIIDTSHDFTIEKISLNGDEIKLLTSKKGKTFIRLS